MRKISLINFLIETMCAFVFLNMSAMHAQAPSTTLFIELLVQEDLEGMKSFFSEINLNFPTVIECKRFINELSIIYGISSSKLSVEKLNKKIAKNFNYFNRVPICLQTPCLFKFNPLETWVPVLEEDFSGNGVIGLLEIFVGTLLCVIPVECVQAVGVFLIGDGTVRVAGELIFIDGENKKNALENESSLIGNMSLLNL